MSALLPVSAVVAGLAYWLGLRRGIRLGHKSGRDELLAEQGREAEAIWQSVRAEMQREKHEDFIARHRAEWERRNAEIREYYAQLDAQWPTLNPHPLLHRVVTIHANSAADALDKLQRNA